MRKYLFSDSALKIISVIVAIVLWMYVMSEQNPHVTYVIRDVPVKLINLDRDRLALEDESEFFVNVKINGRRSIVTEVKQKDIKAEVDLRGRMEGENLVPIKVSVPQNIEMIDFYPKEILISLDAIVEEQMSVSVNIKGEPQEGFAVGEPVVKPEAIFVRGPRSKVDAVKRIVAQVDVSDKNSNIVNTVPLKALDSKGNVQKGVTIWPKTVEVSVSIVPINNVAIIPNIIGNPSPGFTIKDVKLETSNIPITGDSETLRSVNNISTKPINVENQKNSFEREVELIFPKGIQPVKDEKTVKVKVEVEKLVTRNITLSYDDLVVDNLPQDAEKDSEGADIVLTILGPESTIKEVNSDMVKVYTDAIGLPEGEHEIKIKATIDKPYIITNIEPDRIKVTIH